VTAEAGVDQELFAVVGLVELDEEDPLSCISEDIQAMFPGGMTPTELRS
jgi:hypothetical protein